MPRPRKRRCCRRYRCERVFKPRGIPMTELASVRLEVDEFEALRLCDGEGLDQGAAGLRMGISRGTVQRLLGTARGKLVTALLNRQAILIAANDEESNDARMHSDQ